MQHYAPNNTHLNNHLNNTHLDNHLNNTQLNKDDSPLFSKVGCIFLTVTIVLLLFMVQEIAILIVAPLLLDNDTNRSLQDIVLAGSQNGTVVSIAMLFTLLIIVASILVLVAYKIKQYKSKPQNHKICATPVPAKALGVTNQSTFDFLAIKPFSGQQGWFILGLFVVYSLFSELVLYILNKEPNQFMDSLYLSVYPKGLLVVVVVFAAPIYEELIFRGVLWSALRQQLNQSAGVWLATIVTSLLFALIHAQYDAYGMVIILIFAFLLSFARVRSGSLLMPILLHMLNNAMAMGSYIWLR